MERDKVCRFSKMSNFIDRNNKSISVITGVVMCILLMFCLTFLLNLSTLMDYLKDGGVLHTLRVIPYLQPKLMALTVLPVVPFIYMTRRAFEKRQIPIVVLAFIIALFIIGSQSLIQTHTFSTLWSNGLYAVLSLIALVTLWVFIFLLLRPAAYAILNGRTRGIDLNSLQKNDNQGLSECGYLTNEGIHKSNRPQQLDDEESWFARISSFPVIFGVLIIAWLPYAIIFFPGSIGYDMLYQLTQLFGDEIQLSGHHPVITTLIYAFIFSFGDMLGGNNVGLFFMTLFQLILMAAVLSFEVIVIARLNAPCWIVLLSVAFFALYPIFPCYSDNAVKDVLFSISFVLYFSLYVLFIKSPCEFSRSPKWMTALIVASILCGTMRNNGVYIVLFSLPFLIVFLSDIKVRLRTLSIFVLGIIMIPALTSVVMISTSAESGSIREALSVPFMQSARSYIEHSDEMSEHELDVLDNTFVLEDIEARYNPSLSDDIKNRYVEGSSLIDYFQVWAAQGLHYPMTYLDAWGELTFGYWSLTIDPQYDLDRFYNSQENSLKDNVEIPFEFDFLASFNSRQEACKLIDLLLQIPFIGFLMQGGTYTWSILILGAFLIFAKKPKYIVLLLPGAVLMLTDLFGPMNGLLRYFLGEICIFPLLMFSCVAAMQDRFERSSGGLKCVITRRE